MAAAGLPSSKLPVMSFSIAEPEAKAMGPSLVEGSYAAWNYFQTLADPANKKFVAAYQGEVRRRSVVDDPMAHGYLDVYAWAAAAKAAKSFDPDKVRKAAVQLEWKDVVMGKTKFAANQSLIRPPTSASSMPSGQFKILWNLKKPIYPVPYDPLSFPGKKCVIH